MPPKACYGCAARKTKCDKANPSCGRCVKDNRACSYPASGLTPRSTEYQSKLFVEDSRSKLRRQKPRPNLQVDARITGVISHTSRRQVSIVDSTGTPGLWVNALQCNRILKRRELRRKNGDLAAQRQPSTAVSINTYRSIHQNSRILALSQPSTAAEFSQNENRPTSKVYKQTPTVREFKTAASFAKARQTLIDHGLEFWLSSLSDDVDLVRAMLSQFEAHRDSTCYSFLGFCHTPNEVAFSTTGPIDTNTMSRTAQVIRGVVQPSGPGILFFDLRKEHRGHAVKHKCSDIRSDEQLSLLLGTELELFVAKRFFNITIAGLMSFSGALTTFKNMLQDLPSLSNVTLKHYEHHIGYLQGRKLGDFYEEIAKFLPVVSAEEVKRNMTEVTGFPTTSAGLTRDELRGAISVMCGNDVDSVLVSVEQQGDSSSEVIEIDDEDEDEDFIDN